ncbi:peptide deformylase [Soehngenia saccharolytica]|nr:peptide deformylase [Soehngenia saccharolytica]
MAIRKIRIEGDPILRKKSKEIITIDERILQLAQDMIETMRDANGIGLAAPQAGVLRRIIVLEGEDSPIIAINPNITYSEGEITDLEGCLSIPGYSGYVKRAEKIIVEYIDENRNTVKREVSGYLARAFMHEIDHLDGILYIDRAEKIYKESEAEEGV